MFGLIKTFNDCIVLYTRVSFEEKEKIKLKRQEVDEVKNLDNWQPADPLTPAMQFPVTQG